MSKLRGSTDLRGEKIIDSRDLIARFEWLEDDRNTLVGAIDEAKDELAELDKDSTDEDLREDIEDKLKDAEQALKDWDDLEEYTALKSFIEEAGGYSRDFQHGETLIRDDYFEEYAQELAEDIGAIKETGWPCNCIDWEKAADELKMDYSSFELDGTTYWMRS